MRLARDDKKMPFINKRQSIQNRKRKQIYTRSPKCILSCTPKSNKQASVIAPNTVTLQDISHQNGRQMNKFKLKFLDVEGPHTRNRLRLRSFNRSSVNDALKNARNRL